MAKIDFKNVQTMIGNGAVVNGPISLNGGIIIYGKVYGDIQTDGPLRITISGKVFGNIQASDAHIGGSIKGDISVSNKIKHLGLNFFKKCSLFENPSKFLEFVSKMFPN